MDVQDEVEKKMTIETKLLAAFLVVYIASAMVPGIVTYLIDHYVQDGILSDAIIGLVTFCVLLIFIALIAQYLMKWITKPVRKLCLAAEEMVNGNLDVDLEVDPEFLGIQGAQIVFGDEVVVEQHGAQRASRILRLKERRLHIGG